MDQKQMSAEMIEFSEAVERLWAAYDLYEKLYDEDETISVGRFDLNRRPS